MSESEKSQEKLVRVRSLLRSFVDCTLSQADREFVKNALISELVDLFKAKIFAVSKGKIGIADSLTELQNSAFIYLQAKATDIAEDVEMRQMPIAGVVSAWLQRWAIDRIRRSDGQTLKRGRGMTAMPLEVAGEIAEGLTPVEILLREEAEEQIRASVRVALERLTDIEKAVTMSYIGEGQHGRLTMREVASDLGVSLAEVTNARRRANAKLRDWLAKFARRRSFDSLEGTGR